MVPKFTVDWEDWYNAVIDKSLWNQVKRNSEIFENTLYLLRVLDEHKIKAIFYILGHTRDVNHFAYKAIVSAGHTIGSHGYWHGHNEHSESELFRSPYWDTTPLPGLCGGFFFRLLPLWLIKREIKRTGIFYLHPHDIMLIHPNLKNPILNWKRKVGLKHARGKLERLLNEVSFSN